MVLTIGDKEYEVNFGIRFVRELDKKYFTTDANGVKWGMGLEIMLPQILMANDALILSEVLYMGTCTLKSRPTPADVDTFIDECEDIEALFDEVIEELKKQNATKTKLTEIEKIIEAEKNLEKKAKK